MSFVIRIRAWRARRNERRVGQDALDLKERTDVDGARDDLASAKDGARDDFASVRMGGQAGHWAERSGEDRPLP